MGKSIFQTMLPPNQPVTQQPLSGAIQFANPIQKMQYIMQAMTNPAAFVKQAIPDLPPEIANDPNQILQYLQKSRGISNEQIQQLMGQMPNSIFRR